MNQIETATTILKYEEGFVGRPYLDSEGYPTIGYGIKIAHNDVPLELFEDFPDMPASVAEEWLRYLVNQIDMTLTSELEQYYEQLDDVRKAVLISMGYQLGIYGLAQFKQTIAYVAAGSYEMASVEMLDSLWARQVPRRAERHSYMMREGELSEYYRITH